MVIDFRRTFQYSCQGPMSRVNSDASGLFKSDEKSVVVVCDGVSSTAHGREAANLTVEAVLDACRKQSDWSRPLGLAEAWGMQAHATVVSRLSYGGLCTLVLAIIANGRLWGIHAGDSSCVVIPPTGEAVRMTEPHRKSVLRRLNGKPVYKDGMPVFDQGLTRAVGQRDPLVLDTFEGSVPGGTWVACFTDGVEESSVVKLVRRNTISEQVVESLVNTWAEQTADDATLILLQCIESLDNQAIVARIAQYGELDAAGRSLLLDELRDKVSMDMLIPLVQAYEAESEDGRATRIVRLILSEGGMERYAVCDMLDRAILRRQVEATTLLKSVLASWASA